MFRSDRMYSNSPVIKRGDNGFMTVVKTKTIELEKQEVKTQEKGINK